MVIIMAALAMSAGCCLWNPNVHTVRVILDVEGITLSNVKIGPASYGTVEHNIPTEYKELERKTPHKISYGSANEKIGEVTLEGLGTHLWTLTILRDGDELAFSLSEEL